MHGFSRLETDSLSLALPHGPGLGSQRFLNDFPDLCRARAGRGGTASAALVAWDLEARTLRNGEFFGSHRFTLTTRGKGRALVRAEGSSAQGMDCHVEGGGRTRPLHTRGHPA